MMLPAGGPADSAGAAARVSGAAATAGAAVPHPGRAVSGPDLLPCGRAVGGLVDQVDAGRLEPLDAHQAICRHCRSALRDAAVSAQALRLLRASTGPVPAGLVDRVMAEVRRRRVSGELIELGPGRRSVGGSPPDGLPVVGGVRVHPQVLADLARIAAGTVRGVTVARASATGRPQPPPGRSDRTGRVGGIELALGLLVDGRTPLPELARSVRRVVRAAVRRASGAERVEVALTALDLLSDT